MILKKLLSPFTPIKIKNILVVLVDMIAIKSYPHSLHSKFLICPNSNQNNKIFESLLV